MIRCFLTSLVLRFGLLLLVLNSCATARTQPDTSAVDFFVDNASKVYYLLGDDQLVTDNPLGGNRFAYYDSSLGAPTSVDVTSPFTILLFYADYGKIVVLDRTLNEVSRIDLLSLTAVEQAVAAARAADNGIWIFDDWDYHLKLLDAQGNLRLESNDLRLTIRESAVPDAIYVDRSRVLLHYRDARKLAVFTNYGRFERWVKLPEATFFGWRPPLLTGSSAEGLWAFHSAEKGARPQVQRQLAGKAVAGPGGYHCLVPPQEVTWKLFEK